MAAKEHLKDDVFSLYSKLTVLDFEDVRIFLFVFNKPAEFVKYLLRFSEAYNFYSCLYLNRGYHKIDRNVYRMMCEMLYGENPYLDDLYGICIDGYFKNKFLKVMDNLLLDGERAILDCLIDNECISKQKNKKYLIKNRYSFIVINNYLCRNDGIEAYKILAHELSHILFKFDNFYRNKINYIFKSLGHNYQASSCEKLNEKYGYPKFANKNDYSDEWAAHLISDGRKFIGSLKFVKNYNATKLHEEIRDLFKTVVSREVRVVKDHKNSLFERFIHKFDIPIQSNECNMEVSE